MSILIFWHGSRHILAASVIELKEEGSHKHSERKRHIEICRPGYAAIPTVKITSAEIGIIKIDK